MRLEPGAADRMGRGLEARRTSNNAVGNLSIAVFVASFLYALWCTYGRDALITDSWTYFELSRSIGADFYKINTWRSFGWSVPYSAAYPPLWPVLLRLAQGFAGPEIAVSIALAFVTFLCFAALAEVFVRSVWGLRWVGLTTGAVLLGFWCFLLEILRGAAMPLTALLTLACAYVFIRYQRRAWMPLALGAIAGLGVMSRFDFLPSALVLIVLVGIFERTPRAVVLAAAGLAVTISPWVLYSSQHFHSLFVTDAGGTALSVDPRVDGNDFYAVPPASAFQDPLGWGLKLVHFLPDMVGAIFQALLYPVVPAILVLVFAIQVARRVQGRDLKALVSGHGWRESANARLFAFGLVIVAPWPGCLATGWAVNPRYYSPLVWFSTLSILVFLGQQARSGNFIRSFTTRAKLAIAGLLLVGAVNFLILTATGRAFGAYPDPTRFDSAVGCLTGAGATRDQTVMFVGGNDQVHDIGAREDYTMAAEFGARTGWQTTFQPSNWDRLSPAEIKLFAKTFHVHFIYAHRTKWLMGLIGKAEVSPLPGCSAPVFRFSPSGASSRNAPDLQR